MAQGVSHEIEVGDIVNVGMVCLEVEKKSGRKVRLRIVAPVEMEISHQKNEAGESRIVAEKSA